MKKMNLLTVSLGLLANVVFAQQPATTVAELPAQTQNVATTTTTVANSAQPATQVLNPNLVNINTASAAEIQDKLVGIGTKKAQAIVDYRAKNGTFASLEQLKEVSGIGNAILDKNRERIILQ